MNTVESVSFPKFMLSRSGLNQSAQRRLLRATDLPEWVLNSPDTMVHSAYQLQLWEQLEHELDVVGHEVGDARAEVR